MMCRGSGSVIFVRALICVSGASDTRFILFFKNNAIGELDFVVEYPRQETLRIEVEFGKSYKRHSALNKALSTLKYGMNRGMVFVETNTEITDSADYPPVYMVPQCGTDGNVMLSCRMEYC